VIRALEFASVSCYLSIAVILFRELPNCRAAVATRQSKHSLLLFNREEQRPKGIVNIPPMTDKIYFDTGFTFV
jgi:hypothetical protein